MTVAEYAASDGVRGPTYDASDGLRGPAYGVGALADLLPAALAALGVPGERDVLGLPPGPRVCVLLVDGLGERLLRRHAEAAPFLSTLPGRTLTAGFPTTTATSLASLGTGLPPGEHGLTGYTSYVEDVDAAVNWLAWRPVGESRDLRDRLVPEAVQPEPTAFERAAAAGVAVTVVAPRAFQGSGLTRAVLRGGRYVGTVAPGESVARAAAALDRGSRALVYTYLSELDLVGHVRGPETDEWCAQLALVDRAVEQLAARLPPDAVLYVTADHGMVAVPDDAKVDADDRSALRGAVIALAGEPRARHVHTRRGACDDVRATWRELLEPGMAVLTRAEAVAAGLFGPTVTTEARARIGDLVVIARAPVGVVQRDREGALSALPGQHGALTDDELLVPLLRADRA